MTNPKFKAGDRIMCNTTEYRYDVSPGDLATITDDKHWTNEEWLVIKLDKSPRTCFGIFNNSSKWDHASWKNKYGGDK